jgi:hypothetical protein
MSTKTLTDEDLVKLYQDPNFTGSFSGMTTFKHFLYTDYGEVSHLLNVFYPERLVIHFRFLCRTSRPLGFTGC